MEKNNNGAEQKRDEDRIQDINGVNIYLNKLMNNVNEAMLDDMKSRFQLNKDGKVNEKELLAILKSYQINLSDEDIKPMFAKIDIKKKGSINFLDFVAYQAYEFRTKQVNKKLTAKGEPKLTPTLLAKETIEYDVELPNMVNDIQFIPFTNQQEEARAPYSNGTYVLNNVTKGIQLYTSDLKWICTHKIEAETMVVMPEHQLICVSTTDQLRFYDASPDEFQLRLTVTGVLMVTCMAHTYDTRTKFGFTRLAAGTHTGDVLVLEFLPVTKNSNGPFSRSDVDRPPPTYAVAQLQMCNDGIGGAGRRRGPRQQRRPPPFQAVWFNALQPGQVIAVAFCDVAGRRFVSVCESRGRAVAYCRVDRTGRRGCLECGPVRYVVSSNGAQCLCTVGPGLVATGDRKGLVTLWNVDDAHAPPVAELYGHRYAVCHVFYDRTVGRLFSVSSDLTLNVWDVQKAVLLATLDVSASIASIATATGQLKCPPRRPACLAAHFDQTALVLTAAVGNAFVAYTCHEHYDGQSPDHEFRGVSHDSPVVKTMYNRLFHVLVSVSAADSTIAVWNPSTGRPIVRRPMAHRREWYGQMIPVEITAAAFDPSFGLLVTGAADGTVRVWNLIDLTSLNGSRIQIPSRNRITDIVWVPEMLLVTGRDRRVTEIATPLELPEVTPWMTEHEDEVLSMCANPRSMMLVTTTRAGLMGVWTMPSRRLDDQHRLARSEPDDGGTTRVADDGGTTADAAATEACVAAVASRFLHSRPEATGVGKLLVATCDGVVQLWATHPLPTYVTAFVASHVPGDHVTCMSSDARDQYVFTGLRSGYVKTWYVAAFGCPRPPGPAGPQALRMRFPYLLHSLFVGRADRAHRAKNAGTGPMLVNSFRAHTRAITHVEYMDGLELLVSSSVDMSVRVWTLAGHIIGVLGTPWSSLPKTGPVHLMQYPVPADIVREASYTTIKILKKSVDSGTRTTEFWNRMRETRQKRQIEGKTTKRQMQGDDYSIVPLLLRDEPTDKDLQDRRPLKLIDYDVQQFRVQVFKHLPTSDLAEIPDLSAVHRSSPSKDKRKRIQLI